MMDGKALLFGDKAIAEQIMQARSPRKMKALGPKVRHFKEGVWKANRVSIVRKNNVAKFTQNEKLCQALLKTTGLLAEASPSDKIWGIGLNESKAKVTDPSKWPGLNLLGQVLTDVREEIRASIIHAKFTQKRPAHLLQRQKEQSVLIPSLVPHARNLACRLQRRRIITCLGRVRLLTYKK